MATHRPYLKIGKDPLGNDLFTEVMIDAETLQGESLDDIVKSVSYDNLLDKPVIPSRYTDLDDDIGLASKAYVDLVKSQIPTLLSELTNDTNFINTTELELVRNSIPTDTSQLENSANFTSKEYVDDIVSKIPKFAIEVVDSLPLIEISPTTVYLLRTETSETDLYDEFIYIDNRWELLGSARINLDDYAKKVEIPKKNSELENDSNFTDKNYVNDLFVKLSTDTALKFFCVEPVTVTINGKDTVYPANSNVEIFFRAVDEFSITPTSSQSILSLSGYPGALGTFYDWLEGVAQFSNILFDMNDAEMYTKWNQNNQGDYHVQEAQYVNCIFWSDNPYINDITLRTNYTLYNSMQLPLCYSTIRENTFKPFYLAYGVQNDPNWANPNYTYSFSTMTSATAPFTYYGGTKVGVFDMAVNPISLPKDCRGLMFWAKAMQHIGVLDATLTTTFGAKSGSWREAFGYCWCLEDLYIKNLHASINISWSPINQESIKYILSNATNTSKITISLSPFTYYSLTGANKTLAAEKNITLAVITTNVYEDKRISSINITGDGNSVLANDGTYKTLPTKLSQLEQDIVKSSDNYNLDSDTDIPTTKAVVSMIGELSNTIPKVTVGAAVTEYAINPNSYYIFEAISSDFTISFSESSSEFVSEYKFQISIENNPVIITFPQEMIWKFDGNVSNNTNALTFNNGYTYLFNIINNIGVITSIRN